MSYGLVSELDFLTFCSGLALLISAVPALRAARRGGESAAAWRLYAGFAAASGLADWLVLARQAGAPGPAVGGLTATLLTAAQLSLFGLLRRAQRRAGRPALSALLPGVGLVLAVVGAVLGHGDTWLRWALALPVSVAAAAGVWRLAPISAGARPSDRLVALALVGRAAALCAPSGAVSALLLGGSAAMLLVGVGLRLAGRGGPSAPATRRADLAVVVAVATSALAGWFSANHYEHRLADDLHGRLLRQVIYLARTVSPDQARQLTFTANDRDSAADQELRVQMKQYNRAFGLWNTYSFARRGDHLIFGPESLEPTDPMASPPGTIYERPAPPFWQVLDARQALAFGPYQDEYGTFHSGIAPVLDPRTGNVVMAVGVDMQATEWQAQIRRGRAVALLLSALITTLLLLVWLASDTLQLRSRRRVLLTPDAMSAALAGVVLTALAVWMTHGAEERRRQAGFRGLAEAQAQVVAQLLRDSDNALGDAAHLLDQSGSPQAAAWAGAQMPLLVGRGGLRELWLAPRRAADGHFVVARQADIAGSGPALDVDLSAEPGLRDAVAQALRSGSGAASAPVDGRLAAGREGTLLVVRAVGGGAARATALVVGVLDPQQLLHHGLALTSYDSSQARVGLAELADGRERMLAWHPRDSDLARNALGSALSPSRPDRAAVFPVFMFGRTLALGVAPSPAFDARNPLRAGWRTLFSGLVVTLLLTLLLHGYGARRDELERLVASRTASLRDSEERFRNIVQAIPDAIFIADGQGRFVVVNDAACQQLGYTAAELLTMRAADIVEPAYAQRAEQRLALMRGDAGLLESAHIRRDGSVVPVEVAVMGLDFGGQPCLLGIARDVTARRAAEEAMRESEARYRLLFETAGSAIFLMRGDRYVDCNERALAMFGCARGDVIGHRPQDFSPPEQPGGRVTAELARSLINAALGGEPQAFAWRHRRLDGHEFHAEVSLTAVDVGPETLLQAIVTDVSERVRAEEALRQSEAYRQRVFEGSLVPIVVMDAVTHVFVDANPAAAAIYGYASRDEVVGKTPVDVSTATQYDGMDSAEMARLRCEQALAQGGVVFQWRHQRASGQTWDAEVHLQRFDAGDRPLLQFTLQDISERLAAEEALRTSEANLKLITDNMSETVWTMDLSGRYLFINPAIEQLTGWTPAEYLRLTMAQTLPAESAAFCQRVIAEELALAAAPDYDRGRVVTFTLECQRRDKARYWAEISACLLWSAEGQPNGIVGLTRDITAKRRADAEREALISRLEQSNAELERFTYTVSHDLKSPLITIKGFLSWLRADYAKGRTDRIESSMDRIANAAEHMGRLLDELLELSRIGRLGNAPTAVSMSQLAREAAELVTARLEVGGVVVDIQPDLPTVIGDRPRLLEVMQNLLDNAAKFIGEQASPRIRVGSEGHDPELGWPLFYVSDNGQGFEPAYAERIFGLFDQLDPKREGTGIGLAMVKRIIEVHGGRVWAESAGEGQGACFWFTLPPEGGAA
ncbi:MAG: PAS domain S-box protein [Armatimonadetes bacterium]|nr:PAS domain S-box protein [Armatimonadota bacterium]